MRCRYGKALEGGLYGGERAEKLCSGFGKLGDWNAVLSTGDGEGVHGWEPSSAEQRAEVYPSTFHNERGDGLERKSRVGHREVLLGERDRQMLNGYPVRSRRHLWDGLEMAQARTMSLEEGITDAREGKHEPKVVNFRGRGEALGE